MGEFHIKKGCISAVSKTFRFPESLNSELEKIAKENNISLNNLVVQCLEFALENIEKDE
ncbi:toxin-antitoxin system HicB family antitoxin [Flexilinea flocculi]|jgi:predicted HicB family RNase H-like nuclease|uniref:HicB family n=1 Tax=Flexilinea flocculi TaxID=1678840 RepID=A0A0S7BTK2_9CHLR|nr:HicB family [Flexilinea flocculi]